MLIKKVGDCFRCKFSDKLTPFVAISTRSYQIKRGVKDPEFGHFLQQLRLDDSCTIRLGQVHSNKIKIVKETPSSTDPIIELPGYDGVVTQQPKVSLTVATADCVPVLLYSSTPPLIGAIHAGWQGLYENIVGRLGEKLHELKASPAECKVVLGPSISKPHYEVGKEFRQYFPDFVEERGGRLYLGLKDVLVYQLKKEGIRAEHIYATPWCTYDNNDLFFSYRREKTEFRNISLVSLHQLKL